MFFFRTIFALTLIAAALPSHSQSSASDTTAHFVRVERQPEYPGGYGEMMKFIKKEMKYPKEARRSRIEGTIMVTFVVGKDGSLNDVKTLRGIHPDCDAEAERIIKAMPNWIPGKVNDKPVLVRFNMPIKFKL